MANIGLWLCAVAAYSLTIGEKARVTGEIIADDVLVHGTVHGRIRSRRIQVAKSARVRGDILHELLAIDSGAFVEGHCKRTDKPTEALEGNSVTTPAPAGAKKGLAEGAKQTKRATA
jgi:cytoskeletal protein CcmA (bactofilin family)